jgi:hypothetical protein
LLKDLFLNFIPPFFYFKPDGLLGWTHFWKGAIQGPFLQSLVAIGPVVYEEKIELSLT